MSGRELSVVEIQERVRAELGRLADVVEPLGRLFAEAGEEISLVGGPVRDIMLGRLQQDLDLTTSARPDVTERLLKDVPRTAGGRTGAPVIEVDRSRAYLNDPKGKRVYEVDYNDDLRVARTFDLDIRPSLMVETGR